MGWVPLLISYVQRYIWHQRGTRLQNQSSLIPMKKVLRICVGGDTIKNYNDYQLQDYYINSFILKKLILTLSGLAVQRILNHILNQVHLFHQSLTFLFLLFNSSTYILDTLIQETLKSMNNGYLISLSISPYCSTSVLYCFNSRFRFMILYRSDFIVFLS